jgi:hypothetical protein
LLVIQEGSISMRAPYIFSVIFAAAILGACSSAARAEMEVIESNAPNISKGSRYPDDAQLDIPPGKSVRVLVLPSKTIKTLFGPQDGNKAWGGARGGNDDE